MNNTLPKYTPEDIDRIAENNLVVHFHEPILKRGTIGECRFTFPNGNKHCWCEFGFPMNEENHNTVMGHRVVVDKAKNKLWEIAGQYTLATGEML
jgi:hypothetical protein